MYAQWNTSSDFDQSVDSARVAADNNDNGHEDERRDTEPTDHPADRPNALNGLIGAVTKLVDGVLHNLPSALLCVLITLGAVDPAPSPEVRNVGMPYVFASVSPH
ncbi:MULTISPECIES: hypothetical protein [unclassified Devosia]|uniref:hypothetical protein n=1 Tax=unclassified Devosia TaxID=196773 RepID=UPI00086F7460|nr:MULTISPECIES: hypothetical protein [unclassified Devosia]MBN9362091.1 hypothetical protein [Devosia sp.]ODS87190.1 MAG: hypothetical protein ABS47_12605 [Devosia sp. SCN 66-27]OJX24641.1 MAG: hypothetical protein BGO83_08530 [Devosia sp. 66-14]